MAINYLNLVTLKRAKVITIKEIEQYFDGFNHTNEQFILNSGETITNSKLFVDSHLSTLKRNSGNKTFMPYYNRLIKYYKLCKNHQ